MFKRQSECASFFPAAASVGRFAFYDMSLAAYWACRAYYRVVGLHRLLCRFGLGCLCRIGILRCVRLFFGSLYGLAFRLLSWFRRLLLRLFLHVFVTHYCYVTVAVVGQNVVDYRGDLFFQFVDKLSGVIFLVLNVAQFLLPYTREFAALEQFFLDGVNEFYARRSGNNVFLSRLM